MDRIARVPAIREQELRASRSTRLGTGTLACGRCDAPVAPTPAPMSLADSMTCPFCRHHAPVRDFLSLAVPSRPARVAVRVVMP